MATRILAYFFFFIFLSPIYALGQGLKDVTILDSNANTANIVILIKLLPKKIPTPFKSIKNISFIL